MNKVPELQGSVYMPVTVRMRSHGQVSVRKNLLAFVSQHCDWPAH